MQNQETAIVFDEERASTYDKRAGADIILTYFAKDVAEWLRR